ncbi:hypothetical protein C4D60_Mb09t09290 [Musa balbisiana]|uniref:Zinc finger LSD1-type domain-containing protein n=1 Tax=Musa balbisiana TaxID=52838 RepID=A0A4S8IHK3_MUSBA|nr:hypothetical protein C4D60_Mb09t09290 [Musa balbisiana]
MQSQLVCSGCRSILLYPRGATDVRCAICSTITAAASPGSFRVLEVKRVVESKSFSHLVIFITVNHGDCFFQVGDKLNTDTELFLCHVEPTQDELLLRIQWEVH